jgi:hypothetical protein
MGMETQDIIDGIKADIDEIGQVLKDYDKIRQLVTVESVPEEDSAQNQLVEFLLVVAGHQETYGHEHVKAAAKQWLEENVSGLGDFYADDETYEAKARAFGARLGKEAAGHCFDGNTPTEEYRKVFDGVAEGDPAVMMMEPAPLSGEWADGLVEKDVLVEAGVPERGQTVPGADYYASVIEAFEDAFSTAFWDEIDRVCRYQLEVGCPNGYDYCGKDGVTCAGCGQAE